MKVVYYISVIADWSYNHKLFLLRCCYSNRVRYPLAPGSSIAAGTSLLPAAALVPAYLSTAQASAKYYTVARLHALQRYARR